MFFRPTTARKINLAKRFQEGFTLPELLVASLIAALIAGVTAQVMISQLLEGRRLEVAQRVREDVSRLNYLIQIETSEAERIQLAGNGLVPAGCPVGDAEAFTLVVPRPEGDYADESNLSRIRYYNADDPDGVPAIWRCGPPVTRNGVLIHNADPLNNDGVVMRNAELDRDPAGCQASFDRSVTYRILPTGIPGSNIGDLGGCITAHARSVFVCNPAIDPSDLQIGDCPP